MVCSFINNLFKGFGYCLQLPLLMLKGSNQSLLHDIKVERFSRSITLPWCDIIPLNTFASYADMSTCDRNRIAAVNMYSRCGAAPIIISVFMVQ